jgi:hypothetical protein
MVLCDDLEDLNIVNMTLPRFFGRSSGFYLIEIAQQLKREHDGPSVRQPEPTHRKEFWLSDVGGKHCPHCSLLIILYPVGETSSASDTGLYFPP